jgi:hypothetical protein
MFHFGANADHHNPHHSTGKGAAKLNNGHQQSITTMRAADRQINCRRGHQLLLKIFL